MHPLMLKLKKLFQDRDKIMREKYEIEGHTRAMQIVLSNCENRLKDNDDRIEQIGKAISKIISEKTDEGGNKPRAVLLGDDEEEESISSDGRFSNFGTIDENVDYPF